VEKKKERKKEAQSELNTDNFLLDETPRSIVKYPFSAPRFKKKYISELHKTKTKT